MVQTSHKPYIHMHSGQTDINEQLYYSFPATLWGFWRHRISNDEGENCVFCQRISFVWCVSFVDWIYFQFVVVAQRCPIYKKNVYNTQKDKHCTLNIDMKRNRNWMVWSRFRAVEQSIQQMCVFVGSLFWCKCACFGRLCSPHRSILGGSNKISQKKSTLQPNRSGNPTVLVFVLAKNLQL